LHCQRREKVFSCRVNCAQASVRERALLLLKKDSRLCALLPTFTCAAGGAMGSFAGAYLIKLLSLSDAMPWLIFGSFGGVAVGGTLGGFVGKFLLWWKLRPYIHQVSVLDEVVHT
jgi:hypothetical protein